MPLTPKQSDIDALAKIAAGDGQPVLPFEVSRLVALSLVEKHADGSMKVTEKGLEFLNASRRPR